MAKPRIYTRTGDDGSTGLYFGGRVQKDHARVEAYGTVDEAQALLGVARAGAERGSELDTLLVELERDLWTVMAELATEEANRSKLGVDGVLAPTRVAELEAAIDDLKSRFDLPAEFVVPGETSTAAALDLARTVVRRAERRALAVASEGSQVVPYLNRLSDLLWALARWQENGSLPARPDREDHDEKD